MGVELSFEKTLLKLLLKWNQQCRSITFDLYESTSHGCIDHLDVKEDDDKDEGDDDENDMVGAEVGGEPFREAKQTEAWCVVSSRWEVIITPYVF